MPRQWIGRLMVAFLWLVTRTLSAQDSTHTGLVFGLHGPGVFLPVSKSAAIRLQAAGSMSSSNGLDLWNASLGASGVFYLRSWDAVRTYISPGISYGYSWSNNNNARTSTPTASFSFGTEYLLDRRFSVFGEFGVAYTRSFGTRLSSVNTVVPFPSSNLWGLANGVGLLFRL